MIEKKNVKPVLKWVGGKRQLIDKIIPLIDINNKTYVEPFVGGGAILFELQPKRAIINDYNAELMNVYQVIKESPKQLLDLLSIHKNNNSESYYYETRSIDRNGDYNKLSDVERAARIMYLNKTCYNGLYRVNSLGQFNSPFGRYKNPNIVNEITIKAVSKYFNENDVKIVTGDYRKVLDTVDSNCFVYLDPPYMPLSISSSFTSYTNNGFDLKDQIILRDECIRLHKKGVKFIQSNSSSEKVYELYSNIDGFSILTVNASRAINSKADKRGAIKEVLITNIF
ncbi:DNA adenine methylase [Erysipelothrix aquatica]|uniref:DNA adenine methylase n=1 Tax=Erysipelothrix aquatica TaxID=2683714 RepID=UPI00135A4D4E|nr:DNA adenine methylase [Erysipelothrix aquatica]